MSYSVNIRTPCVFPGVPTPPPVWPPGLTVAYPVPGVKEALLLAVPITPISHSSGCVVGTEPTVTEELSLPVVAVDLSFGGDTKSLIEKKIAAFWDGVPVPVLVNVTVIEPLDNAVVTGAEKIKVLTPPLT